MPIYVSLLRGINVGGRNRLPMADLRACAEGLGFSDVSSYIQSGNLVLRSRQKSAAAVSKRLGDALLAQFGMQIPVISREKSQWVKLAGSNPFLSQGGVEERYLAVTFLDGKAAPAGLRALEPRAANGGEFRALGTELYLYLPHGSARTKLDHNSIERCLKLKATTRNWRTVNKLLEMLTEL